MAVLFMDHLKITKIGCLATSKGHHPIKDRREIAIIQRDITHRTEVIGRINRVNLQILKASLMLWALARLSPKINRIRGTS